MARNPIPPDRQILIGVGAAAGMTAAAAFFWDWGLLRGWMIAINLVMVGALAWEWSRAWRKKRPKLSPWFVRFVSILGAAPTVYAHRVLAGGRESTGLKRLLFNALVVVHSILLSLALLWSVIFPLLGEILSGLAKLFK